MKIITNEFKEELKNITNLSKSVNKRYYEKLFEMIKNHSLEIQDLFKKQDDHWSVETADLIVLCFELLYTKNINLEETFDVCLPRFYKKLNEIKENV